MIKQPTPQQSRLALNILIQKSCEGFTARIVTKEERESLPVDITKKEWWLMPAFLVDNRYWCGWDVFFGHDIVIDLESERAYTSKNGIFQGDFVFISDYYGFSKGMFYYPAT